MCSAGQAAADWAPPGVDLSRPRLLMRGVDVDLVRARLEREPYQTVARDMMQRVQLADGIALDDHAIDSERFKARAAKDLAFFYAVERTVESGAVVPFASPAGREAVGQRVQDLLVHMYTRSRLAVPPPLGNIDRDISTSEELLQYATAYDTLLGAGWDFGAAEPVIVDNLVDLASELYLNYIVPTSVGFPAASIHQNNHRSKVGAALVTAGVAVADYSPAPGEDPDGIRDPADWIDYGHLQVEKIMRFALVAGDGAYAEGPHYQQFGFQNLIPHWRTWDRLLDGATWTTADGTGIPSMWRHPLFARMLRWALDTTLPNGAHLSQDDAFVGRSRYTGLYPVPPELRSAFAWRWAETPRPYNTDGNVDMGAEAILLYDDSVTPAAPDLPPTQFYVEGGNALLRSDWGPDAVMASVLGEHDTASEFGRDRNGLGVFPESHEHGDPATFSLFAFGERLMLDPGFVDVLTASQMNLLEHHNGILVDGVGTIPYLSASLGWGADLVARPPADGHATLSHGIDHDFADAVRVDTSYGDLADRVAHVRRRFLFPDHRYLAVLDTVREPQDPPPVWTWLLHGNGGGDSDGAFEETPTGGRWTRAAARVDAAVAVDSGAPVLSTGTSAHEAPGRVLSSHAVRRAEATGAEVRAALLVYPTRTGDAPPELRDLALPGAAGLALTDVDGDRRVVAAHRAPAAAPFELPGAQTGIGDAATDGERILVDTHLDGSLRAGWVEAARRFAYAGVDHLDAATPGNLGLGLDGDAAHVYAGNVDPTLSVAGLPFAPVAADGACALRVEGGVAKLRLGRERRATLRAAADNSRPAADPGADRRVLPGTLVTLDGSASCDLDGDALTPGWELVSAPGGSAWSLERTDGWNPQLLADRVGPYRVRLVVTDAAGNASREAEVLIVAGEPCTDGMDGDLDGLIDTDDPDCDAEPTNAAPVATGDAYVAPPDVPFGASESVLANDADPDGDALAAVLETPPEHGTLWLDADGGFTYEPDAGFRGSDAFTYAARDEHGAESPPVEVVLTVGGADSVLLFLSPPYDYLNQGELTGGDVSVEHADGGRVTRVHGEGTLPGVDGGEAAFRIDVRRLGWLPLAFGHVTVRDPALGPDPVTTPVWLGLLAAAGPDAAFGCARAWSRSLGQPYLLGWWVEDADADGSR